MTLETMKAQLAELEGRRRQLLSDFFHGEISQEIKSLRKTIQEIENKVELQKKREKEKLREENERIFQTRNMQIVIRRAAGETLQEIGDQYHLSKERVRSIVEQMYRRRVKVEMRDDQEKAK